MESRIKERLTGALILVAALVVLVPEIFSGRRGSERAHDAPPAAPASEGAPLRTYTADLAAPTQPLASADATNAPEPVVEPARKAEVPPPATVPAPAASAVTVTPGASAPPVARSAPAAPAAPAAASPPPAVPRDTAVAGDWFVQVGSFSQADNAQRYAQQLRAQGYAALVLPPSGAKGLSRVRVGPARTREAAAALQARLEANGHKGAVVGP